MIKNLNAKFGKLVDFDFNRFRLPSFVTKFKPLLFKDGDFYYAILSLEEENGVSGSGISPEDALIDWNDKICAQLSISKEMSATAIRHGKSPMKPTSK
ncbi:hypothetical protein [Pedobacter agri]|uniref:hypothetical protein n=1 Tax=Pedobacter agri TaxID=454586 RepID=UPI0027822140|nr:hypothetical protein [Pedobacter agri]MDQ1142660.1 hypothetical protein [Pedobacter agri]